jgi:hypothetical protein
VVTVLRSLGGILICMQLEVLAIETDVGLFSMLDVLPAIQNIEWYPPELHSY